MSLVLDRVTKRVGSTVHIHETNLTLDQGSMNILLGPTLAGKTSLMRLMAGLDRPSSGSLLWNGTDVTSANVRDRDIAMVYQQFINYPAMTVYENIASPLRVAGRERAEIDRRVREAADLMKLAPMLDRRPLELSGGQQQRCALARALVKNAGLVLLDEPLANLDYKLREELREEIPKIFERSGAIFVYATTEPHEALLLGGHTACLWEGRVTQFGPTLEVYRRPADTITAAVFSDPPMNFIELAKQGGELVFANGSRAPVGGMLAGLADARYRAGFRPNHLTIDPPAGEALAFDAEVVVSEITGSETYVHVDHGSDRWVALLDGVRDFEVGSTARLWVETAYLYLFDQEGRIAAAAPYAKAA